MSWLYLPEQEGDCSLHSICSGGEPYAMSRTEPTQSRYSGPESGTACSTTPPSGTTCEHSTDVPGAGWWISSLRASRASPGRLEERGRAKTMTVISGLTPFALLKRSSLSGFSWRTPQGCFIFPTSGDALPIFNKSWETWPSWGTWDDGAAYRLPVLDLSTNGNGCGLLPTPLARDGKSFYVVTMETALRVMRKKPLRQLHWMQFGVVYHDLKKGWANPRFSELMMGFPIGWTDLRPLGRDKFQQWLKRFGDC